MQALILAGGKGTRLRPYTIAFPKALVPVGDMPIIEIVLRQLAFYGITDIVISVGHLAQLIQAFCGDGKHLGVNIRYVLEDTPLGTAGPLRLIDDLPEHFLVLNADILTDLSFLSLIDTQMKKDAMATIAVYERQSKIDFGTLEFQPESKQIVRFIEKPTLKHSVSMGVYAFHKKVLNYIPENTAFGFDQLMQSLIEDNAPVQAYPFNGYWLDIGRPDDYAQAQLDFESMRERFLRGMVAEGQTFEITSTDSE